MRQSWWTVVVVALILSLCGQVAAQDHFRSDDLPTLRLGLRSQDPRIVAHAAFVAADYELFALVPDLTRALAAQPAPTTWAWRRTANHLLDALICMDARVAMPLLARFEDRLPTATFILAARNGAAAEPLLLRRLSEGLAGSFRETAVAAGNLLAAVRHPQLASLVAARIRTEVVVTVSDHDRPTAIQGRGGVISTCCGSGARHVGWAPIVTYDLKTYGRGTMLAPGGVQSVRYERHVERRQSYWLCGRGDTEDVSPLARGWVALCLGLSEDELLLRDRYWPHHHWLDAARLHAFVAGVRAQVQADARRLLDQLVQARLLAPAQSERIDLTIEVALNDQRDDQRVPLPSIR